MPSGWHKSNPHCPKVPCPVLPLPKPRYLRGQQPQPRPVPTRPRQPTESPSSQNSFPFSLTKGSCFQLRSNKHGGRRGNLFPQHFNEENTHGDANAAAARCLPILLPPGPILLPAGLALLPAGIVQGCSYPPAASAPASQGGLAGKASQIPGMGCSGSRALPRVGSRHGLEGNGQQHPGRGEGICTN